MRCGKAINQCINTKNFFAIADDKTVITIHFCFCHKLNENNFKQNFYDLKCYSSFVKMRPEHND